LGALKYAHWLAHEHWREAQFGIRSAAYFSQSELGTDATECNANEAASYLVLETLFRRIAPSSIDEGQVLLDAGCGLGRAVIHAATHPYTEIIGFDISERLVTAARANLTRAMPRLACPKISVEVANAAEYEIPDRVTTIYIFNAFKGETMHRFIASVQRSLARRPRVVTLAYVNTQAFDPHLYPMLKMVEEFPCYEPREGACCGYRQTVAIFHAGPAAA